MCMALCCLFGVVVVEVCWVCFWFGVVCDGQSVKIVLSLCLDVAQIKNRVFFVSNLS